MDTLINTLPLADTAPSDEAAPTLDGSPQCAVPVGVSSVIAMVKSASKGIAPDAPAGLPVIVRLESTRRSVEAPSVLTATFESVTAIDGLDVPCSESIVWSSFRRDRGVENGTVPPPTRAPVPMVSGLPVVDNTVAVLSGGDAE